MSTRFYLIRHGESTFNAEGRFQGCCDEAVLTAEGIATARAAGEYLRHAGLEAVLSSPLQRAAQTAGHIRAQLPGDLPFGTDPDLREIDLPLWERKALADVRAEYGEPFRMWKEEPQAFRMGGRFPVADLFERAARLWPRLLGRFRGRTVLLVTHGGAGRALIGTAIGMPCARYHVLQQSNGGISLLEFPDGELSSARVLAINATEYEEARLPKIKEAKSGVRVAVIPSSPFAPDGVPAVTVLRGMQFRSVFASSPAAREWGEALLAALGADSRAEIRIAPSLPIPGGDGPLQSILWVADPAALCDALAGAMGLPSGAARRLVPIPATLTVLHRPENDRGITVQGMNLQDAERLARGGSYGSVSAGSGGLR